MRKWSLLLTALLSIALLKAQKKKFTYEQVFRGVISNTAKPLPHIGKWIDDNHYIETKADDADGKVKTFSVDVRTGVAIAYTPPPEDKQTPALPSIKEDGNGTTSPDGKHIAYARKDNNLYLAELVSGKEMQLTTDGSETILNGYASWVYYEEILGRASHYRAFWWSPDSKYICFMRFDETQVPVFPIYWADGQHGFLENQRYPKAGDKNPEVKIGIISLEDNKTVWADFNSKDEQYFGIPYWAPNGAGLWVQWMTRQQNNLKIFAVDIRNGSKKEIYDEKQKTWVGWRSVTFLEKSRQFIILSDKTGWSQLYLYNIDGTLVNQITRGEFTVNELEKADEKTKQIFFTARKENSTRIDFYKIGFDGKGLTRLSFGDYTHDEISLSPNSKYFITNYSNISTSGKTALLDTNGKLIRELGDSRGSEFDNYDRAKVELRRVPSADGLFNLPMKITYPLNFDPNKKYPVLISIYGGPNAGRVYDRWDDNLAVQWWAKEGIIQVAMDNRSSGHFGKTGMDYIYRQMGKYETEDYIDCTRWLRKQPFVDTTKVCITGGSFGGYITCMALTYGADVFTHGMAYYSVTDWSLYDTHYTERFMSTPQDNPDGYKLTSPQNYVKNYKGLLLIVHGNVDDNVHMQNSIQFINKLQDLDMHFEFMIYPGARHGWRGLKKIHSNNEANKFIYEHLLNKPMPDIFWE
jgi:dipeptidyl-peptidase 4